MSRFGGSEFGGASPELGGQYPYGAPQERIWRGRSPEGFLRLGPKIPESPRVPEASEVPEGLEVREESPKLPPARRFKLTVGRPASDRVTVEEIKLDSIPRDIVIDRSRGVQIGEHNRQVNEYRYELDKPTASLDDVFKGHPVRQWAFEKLVANPDGIMPNYFFRLLLPEGPLYSGGRIGFADTGPGKARITVRLGEQGAILVDKSWGVQVANWSTQRNKFLYTVEQPEFHLETALRDPDVARGLAVAVKYPDSPAVQHSLIHRLEGNYDGSSWSIGDVYTKFRADIPRPVTGDGVKLGGAGTRKDNVRIHAGKVILTGWERMAELKVDDQERDQRLEEGRQIRISGSRPPEFVAAGTARAPEGFLPCFIERTATATLDQVAPGRRHLVSRLVAEIKTALDNPEESGNRGDPAGVKISLAPGKVVSGIRSGIVPSGLDAQHTAAEPLTGFRQEHDGEQASDPPRLELVEFVGHERRPYQLDEVTPGVTEMVGQRGVPLGSIRFRWCRLSGKQLQTLLPHSCADSSATNSAVVSSAAEPPTGAMGPRDLGRTVLATGAVLCGSAAAIAATGTRFPDAALLLAYARRRVWDDRYDGRHQSVPSAMRTVQALQVVVFVDPSLGMGLWVDVDPARQTPAAALFIEIDFSAGPPGRCRIFRS